MPALAPPPAPGARPRRAPLVVRLFTAPVTPGAVERRLRRLRVRAGRALRPVLGWAWAAAVAGSLGALGWAVHRAWEARTPWLAPRHRAEAVCFELARPPAFAPPMPVEPDAALITGHFPAGTPPGFALQQAMHFTDDMVALERRHAVGDFEVASLWLRLPEPGGPAHWLVLGWIEDGDLAVCSFRFASRGPVIPPETRAWGDRLIERALKPWLFTAGAVPAVRLRGTAMPTFGAAPAAATR